MITLTYQYKLKVNKKQEREIVHILDVCKSVYNYALSERKDWLNSRKCLADRCSLVSEYIIPADQPYPNYFVQAKNLTEAKKVYPILKTVNAQVLQQVLKTVDKAFDHIKSKGFGFPRFKKKIERGGGNYVRGEGKVHGRGWGIIKNLASCEFSPLRHIGNFMQIIFVAAAKGFNFLYLK